MKIEQNGTVVRSVSPGDIISFFIGDTNRFIVVDVDPPNRCKGTVSLQKLATDGKGEYWFTGSGQPMDIIFNDISSSAIPNQYAYVFCHGKFTPWFIDKRGIPASELKDGAGYRGYGRYATYGIWCEKRQEFCIVRPNDTGMIFSTVVHGGSAAAMNNEKPGSGFTPMAEVSYGECAFHMASAVMAAARVFFSDLDSH
jgi:hypothetical protein